MRQQLDQHFNKLLLSQNILDKDIDAIVIRVLV